MPKSEERKKERIRSFLRSFLKKVNEILTELQFFLPKTYQWESFRIRFVIFPTFG